MRLKKDDVRSPVDFLNRQLHDKRNLSCVKGAVIFSLLSYLYLMVNNLNNYDNIRFSPSGFGAGVRSGRWFLTVLGGAVNKIWGGNYNIPLFNTILAIILLTAASVVIVHLFHIESPGLAFAIGAITVSFPVIGATMFYSFTTHYYAFAILLAVLGVYLASLKKWYCLLSSALFAGMLGIYQAYLPFVAVLLILLLIHDTLDHRIHWKQVLFTALRYLGLLVLGFVLYVLINKLFLKIYNVSLNSYQGIDTMGQIDIKALPRQLLETYRQFFLLVKKDHYSIAKTPILHFSILLNFLFVLFCVISGWKKRGLLKNIELCVLLLLLPIAANAIIIMVPDGYIYTLMVLGLIALFYLPILMAGAIQMSPKTKRAAVALVCAITLLASLNYSWLSNGNYRSLYYTNRKVENYYSQILTRVRSMDGYREDMEIVFVGEEILDSSLIDDWKDTPFTYGGKRTFERDINAYSRPYFMEGYFGLQVRFATEEELLKYASLLEELDTYPNSNSIVIIDNMVFINCQ